ASLAGRRELHELDQQLLALNASPGGAADLLAACLFIDGLEPALGYVSSHASSPAPRSA
ncbi:triphosphoribosyl-dephospho-CoA synthase, partial [Pseudomonas viridiflava]